MSNINRVEQINSIFSEFVDYPEKNDEIFNFFEKQFTKKIHNSTVDSSTVNILLSYIKVHKTIKNEAPENMIKTLVNKKILEIRALTLDILTDDYHEECENFKLRSPDIWIQELTKEILSVFCEINIKLPIETEKLPQKLDILRSKLLQEFINTFLKDSEEVFLSNQKFKQPGNQLVLNFVYFDRIFSQYVSVDESFTRSIYNNIEVKYKLGLDVIRRSL